MHDGWIDGRTRGREGCRRMGGYVRPQKLDPTKISITVLTYLDPF